MDDPQADDRFAPLYAGDLAEQVRETYDELRSFGGTPVAATQETVARFGSLLNDDQDGPVVLVVLAALQVRDGVVFTSIRDAAIASIDSGAAARVASAEAVPLLDELRDILDEIDVADEDEDEDEEDEDEEDED